MLRFTNNIIGQVTLNCNKRCKYCYEHTHNGDVLPNKTSMTFESFKNIFDRCVYERCILGSKENSLMWHFHGGEVFLIPWPELKKMIAYIENRKQFFPNVDWMVQTNGTLVTEEIAAFLKMKGKTLGFSFDGFGDTPRGTAQENQELMDHIKHLYETTGVKCGYLMVLTKDNMKTWIKDFNKVKNFINDLGINHLCGYDEDLYVTPEETWKYWYKPVLKSYLTKENIPERNITIQVIKAVSHILLNYKKVPVTGCFNRICAHGSNMTSIDSEGNIYPCDKFLESGDFIGDRFKMLPNEKDFLGFKTVKYVYDFYNALAEEEDRVGCNICRAKHICAIDCQSANLSQYGKVIIHDDFCEVNKRVYDFIEKNLEKILTLHKIPIDADMYQYINGLSNQGLKFAEELAKKGKRLIVDNRNIYIEGCV